MKNKSNRKLFIVIVMAHYLFSDDFCKDELRKN